jgi:outer membrane protein assembly factor BamB
MSIHAYDAPPAFRKAAWLAAMSALGSAVLVLALDGPADAVSTRSFSLDDAASLAAGELDGTAVHSNGSVTASAETRRIGLDDVPVAYCFARSADGTVYVGTGNDGKIYRLRGEAVTVFAETGQLLVSALAFGADGTLYAGTLPEGRIYEVAADGTVDELVKPDEAEHVWSLVWDAGRRRLLAATGPEGKLYAIDGAGRAEVFWDSDAAHVMSLALDGDGTVYAGTSDDAVVVRLRGPGRAEVVYDFPGNEITALAARDGSLAVAANDFPAPPAARSTKTTATKTSTPSKSTTRPRTGKGRLWRVGSDGRAERVYQNDDGHFTSVQIAEDGTIWAGAGAEGRIYRVATTRTSAMWIDVDERQVTAIDLVGDDPLFLTSDGAAIYRILSERPRNATWTSKVLDAGFTARFGQLTWRGSGAVTVQTRSGNREEPDETWSEWSAPVSTPGPIRSPASRFLQIRVRFPQRGDARLLAVQAYYLPQNQRAVVRDVGLKRSSSSSSSKTKEASKRSSSAPSASSTYVLAWQVDNPDDDELRYRLRFRAEDQTVWRDVLRDDERLTKKEYSWDTSGVPDGWYVVEVEASDELENPAGRALRATSQSEPLLIDNHAPRIEGLRAQGSRVSGRAIDSLGPIARLEYAVDGGEWQIAHPEDDLLDTAEERFTLDVGPLDGGEHIVAVRATDAGGNTVSAETTVRIP